MISPSFTIALLKPEIASGAYDFALLELDPSASSVRDNASDEAEHPLQSPIPGVSPVEAALLFPNGQILAGVFARLASAGLRVRERRVVQLTKAQASALYAHERERFKDETLFRDFVGSFARGLSLALLLEHPSSPTVDDAVARCKQLVGTANPAAARQDALSASLPHDEWPLRALCGLDAVHSGIVCSATLDCFYRERALLFAPQSELLERAVIILLPTFLEALPDGRALLISRLNAGGVLVSRTVDTLQFASRQALALLEKELHTATNIQHREQFAAWLREHVVANERPSVLLELEALGLIAKLREILGPASFDAAQRYFPNSVRAQLPQSLAPALEHVRTAENGASCLDTGVFVSFDAPTISALLCQSSATKEQETAEEEAIERTFAIIKPGAASDGAVVREIHTALRAFGFAVEKRRRLRLSRVQAAAFYGEHRGKPFFERLLTFMTSGELEALQLARRRAIRTWRGLMGPTNALAARETHPWTLRARFGIDGTRNATHGSDAESSARRELRFFFGGGLCAFASGDDGRGVLKAKRVAQCALPPPYAPSLTLEKVLATALGEMLDAELAEPQDACAWLGNWLLAFAARSSHHQQQGGERELSSTSPTKRVAHYRKPAARAQADVGDPIELLSGSARTLVAIAFAGDVSAEQRRAVKDAVRSLAAPRFAVVDVDAALQVTADLSAAVDTLGQQIRAAGCRRVALMGFDVRSAALVRSFSVQLEQLPISDAVIVGSAPPSHVAVRSELDARVPHVYHHLQPLDGGSSLPALLSPIFRAPLVVVHDANQRVDAATWRAVARHFGFALLAFDDLLRARAAKERGPSGPFSQLARTGARVPTEQLLSLVSDAVERFQPTGASDDAALGSAQRYVLCGFPFADAAPSEFEARVGPIDRLLRVETEDERGEGDAWVAHLRKRGAVTDLPLAALGAPDVERSVRDACAPAIGPVVGFCFTPPGEQLDRVCGLALAQGFAALDVAATADRERQPLAAVAHLQHVLFRANGLAGKFLVCGFPPDAMRAFVEEVAVPRFAILPPASSPELERLAGVLDAHPQIAQADVEALPPPRLQSLLFGKRVSFAVGDASELDARRLRSALAPLGFSVLDLRAQQLSTAGESASDDVVGALVARVRATATPRCLVLGAPEDAAFFGAVEKVVGSGAVDRIAVLKRVERRPPPSRVAKRDDDDDDSDDDAELERQQQLRAVLAPHLEQLLQTFSLEPRASAALAVKLAFLSVDRVYEQLRRELQPQLLGVVAHAHSFYRRALQSCTRRHAVASLSASWWSGDCTPTLARSVAKLQRFVAVTSFAAYMLDGFPRAQAGGAAPYAAQQLLALERAALPMRALVHFASSLDVLAERQAGGVTRRVLEDAQDALEDEAGELLARFRSRGQVLSVSCEREVADAEEALDAALARAGVVR